jgi:hypothetical protein
MDTIFTLGDNEEDQNIKINLDDLYERKKQHDLNTLAIYNRILNRIHTRIKTLSRQQTNDQFCWYVIPEMILGVPKYDHEACTAYILDKLKENGFVIRYTHPNMLFISWKHWVPAYVRQEIKKKTGLIVDGYGQPVDTENGGQHNQNSNPEDPNDLMFNHRGNKIDIEPKNNNKNYKSIDSYKPTGNLIYNQDLLKKIENKSYHD